MVEWVTLLLLIREILDSNLGLETAIPTEDFRGFLQASGEFGDSTLT
jgi:hypothetical protein